MQMLWIVQEVPTCQRRSTGSRWSFPSQRDTLDAIRQQTSAASATEVIRRALATYKAIAEAQAAGERIEIVSTDGTRRQLVVV